MNPRKRKRVMKGIRNRITQLNIVANALHFQDPCATEEGQNTLVVESLELVEQAREKLRDYGRFLIDEGKQ